MVWLLSLLALLLAQPGHADHCPDLYDLIDSDYDDFPPPRKANLKEKVFDLSRRAPLYVAAQGGKYYVYPVLGPYRLGAALLEGSQNQDYRAALVKFIRKDGLVLGGVVGTYAHQGMAPAEMATYLLLPGVTTSDYTKQLDDRERKDGITIYVDGVPNGNILEGFGSADFARRFGEQKNAYIVRPENLADMFDRIKRLAKKTGQPIARIEILGHSTPGSTDIRSTKLNSETVHGFDALKGLFSPNAEIRFMACMLGANLAGFKPGENFMKSVGNSAFTKGGSVFAANHTLWVDLPFEQKNERNVFEKAAGSIFSPIMGGIQIGVEGAKALGGSTEPYRRIDFAPAKESPVNN